MRVFIALLLVAGAAADCQSDGCPTGQVCCLCDCNAGDTVIGSFGCK